jgi:phosphatidylserine decarboxylase
MMLRRTPTNAPIAIIAVGAMLLGYIKYEPSAKPGAKTTERQCLGAFYYGRSTVIVLYPPGEVKFDEDLVKNSCELKIKTQMKVG